MERTYKLDELAEAADVTVRTVRYYVQRGLLAAPVFRGRDTSYGEGHLWRLKLIKHLQEERFMPLDAIESELIGRTDQEVYAWLEREKHAKSRPITPITPVAPGTPHHGGPYRAPAVIVGGGPAAPRWVRIVLQDGVEVHVREDTGVDPEALARRMREALALR
ncbi:MAG: MerR family transcriptional regulator [Deltaproteobacteria bacterium]|nr:MerR family transcriptional regulator [Deltaproteobacteria bacterium]